ncbi:MAG: hypothetical protein M1812_004827 [Candelaria pacifica]|nr:MAG: hypothetical protein M1812_004827 [Candelaria pacifica]
MARPEDHHDEPGTTEERSTATLKKGSAKIDRNAIIRVESSLAKGGHELPNSPPTGSATWIYRDKIYPDNNDASTPYAPALASHAGELWCLWADANNTPYYATGTNDKWNHRILFTTPTTRMSDGPALAELDTVLHAVLVEGSDRQMYHYQFDKLTRAWGGRTSLGNSSLHAPALAGFDNQLFCAFTKANNELVYAYWNEANGWNASNPKSTGESTWGTPALYVRENEDIDDDELHLLFSFNRDSRAAQDLTYDKANDNFKRSANSPGEMMAFGCCATSFGRQAYMGFQSHSGTGTVLVSEFDGVRWEQNDSLNELSKDTPALAVLDGVVNCIYNAHGSGHNNLLWSQRPASSYPLDAWMAHLDDNTPLSGLSLPGTHDSCANTGSFVSGVFVDCQTMSITDQLNAGIRYFDLRCKLVNGALLMYHGSVYLDRSLNDVLKEIYNWLDIDRHKEEALVAQVQQEHDSDLRFSAAMKAVVMDGKSRWVLTTTTPILRDVRGKIQLMRRYDAQAGYVGIDLWGKAGEAWKDNDANFQIQTSTGVNLFVQDYYELLRPDLSYQGVVSQKFRYVSDLIAPAIDSDSKTWYLNWTSGYGSASNALYISAEALALGYWDLLNPHDGVNKALRNYLLRAPLKARLGVILMNFPEDPDSDLICAIAQTNG